MKKKLLTGFLIAAMTLSLAGCGSKLSNDYVTVNKYKGLEVKKGRVTVAKKDIEAQVENYRHQFAELTTKENGEVAKGDTVVMEEWRLGKY